MRWKAWMMALWVFAATCVLADWAVTRWFLFRSPFTASGRIYHLYVENDDEIPIFGTSKAHGQYCPADMKLDAYNYGFDSASFELTYVLMEIELAKPKTSPIILELQFSDTGQLGEESGLIPFVSDSRFRRLLEEFHAMSWRYYVPGIRYFGYYDIYAHDLFNECIHASTVNQGFTVLAHTPPFDQAGLNQLIRERLQMRNGYFPEEDQNRRLIGLITSHPGRLFFLVLAPYHPSFFAHFENADKFKAFKEKLAAFPNVVVIDDSRDAYPERDFLDTLHLRREGSQEFSRRMGEQIRQILRERGRPAP